jgi:hypothetical protein
LSAEPPSAALPQEVDAGSLASSGSGRSDDIEQQPAARRARQRSAAAQKGAARESPSGPRDGSPVSPPPDRQDEPELASDELGDQSSDFARKEDPHSEDGHMLIAHGPRGGAAQEARAGGAAVVLGGGVLLDEEEQEYELEPIVREVAEPGRTKLTRRIAFMSISFSQSSIPA